jgi:hypothetical protein
VKPSAFGCAPRGVYYVLCDPGDKPPIEVIEWEAGRIRRLGTLDNLAGGADGLSVSPDGKTIVYPRVVSTTRDLMLIENFR